MIKTLSIDLETYSDVDIAKCGVYKYAASPNFEILLFGYSIDGGEVQVVDLAQGEKIPEVILEMIADDDVLKTAFNAVFERVCLSTYLHRFHPELIKSRYLSPYSWHCTMVWAAYCGYPLSLKEAGAAMGLERQKLEEGKELIRYFCVPCKPTKSNGGRTRNLPEHAMEKWTLFKSYNKRDVEVELQIQDKLSFNQVPESVWDEYHIDQEINDRGILVDMEMVENAIALDKRTRDELVSTMQKITELENPNSVQQLRDWLGKSGAEMESLGKKNVAAILPNTEGDVKKVLQLRQQLAKSSVKKYLAMENAAGDDNRARGMFQFYGANRTGRFCLTGDHEVLTPNGWIRLDEWNGGSIACWNAYSEAVSFQEAAALCFDYSGPMYTYQDSRIDQCSTPDHKMRVQKRYGDAWQDMTVQDMAKCRPCIPLTGNRYRRSAINSDWLRVMIMTQADGNYTPDGSVHFHFSKKRKIERCKHLLRKAGITFVANEYEKSSVIKIHARMVPLWLREFRSKTFGPWLLDEDPDVFFNELPYWDGSQPASNSVQYTTVNKINADLIQALAHTSGRCALVTVKEHSKKSSNWNDAYVVNIWLTPGVAHEIKTKPTIQEYCGKVYCASTHTGYFLVRRNEKVWVTGNSGRLIQIQNLPQNHLHDLDEARALVKDRNFEAMELLYDDIPDTLSQLIRSAFIPAPGYRYYVADFSAIEARVLSYLAGEQWRMEVFEKGGDIYCATASKMFGVPVVKHGENGELRQKGKQAELACIAEGSLVLTDCGLVNIEKVTTQMKVWDGENWVEHDGVVFRGEKEVLTFEGLTATPDHLVFTEDLPYPVEFGYAIKEGLRLRRVEDWNGERFPYKGVKRVYDIKNAGPNHRFVVSGVLVHNCGYGGGVGAMIAMGAIEAGMKEEELQPLVDAWRQASPNIVRFWWNVDSMIKKAIKEQTTTKLGNIFFEYAGSHLFIQLPSGRKLSYVAPRIGVNKFGGESIQYMGVGATKKWELLESYGPKFVENIVQGVSRDILCHAMKNLRNERIVAHVHDELIIECTPDTKLEDICEKMGSTPPWAEGLCLRADGFVSDYYKKD